MKEFFCIQCRRFKKIELKEKPSEHGVRCKSCAEKAKLMSKKSSQAKCRRDSIRRTAAYKDDSVYIPPD